METTVPTPKELRAAVQRLKFAVELAGLRRTAKELGLSPGYVCEILKGTRSFGKKAQIAMGLGAGRASRRK